MRNKLTIILFGLLIAVGWANALAQGTNTTSLLERLKLELVDNQSIYHIDANEPYNEYTNILRISQGDAKFTAGMLNNGDNYIVVSRQGDTEDAATECARVNLNAEFSSTDWEDVTTLYTYTETPPNYAQTFTPDVTGWTATGCTMQTNGVVYITNGGSLTFTIPAGYENAKFLVGIYAAGTNLRGGYFAVNNIVVQVTGEGWVTHVVSGLNSGDQIRIQGARSYNNSYQIYNSPDMLAAEIVYVPSIIPSIKVTPYVGENAGTAQTYSPNDYINLSNLGTITDHFTQSTEEEDYPNSYSYKAELDANVEWPSLGESSDFYASVNFLAGDGSDLETCEYVGPNNWDYEFAQYYNPSGTIYSLYLIPSSEFIYIMPPSFAGNSVNVTVTSTNHSYGAGDLAVNGQSHTFTQGSSYTWTVPVMAGGVISFALPEGNEDGYTCDIAKIVIQSGNGTAQNAPQIKSVSRRFSKQTDNRFTLNVNKDKSQMNKMRVMK